MIAALVNGQPADTIAITDRGLHYGDGVFRTLRVTAGRAEGWAFHCQRLAADCAQLALACPDSQALAADLARLFGPAGNGGDGIAKIAVTRGSGGRGYAPPAAPVCSRVVMRYAAPDYPTDNADHGVAVGIAHIRAARQAALAGAKHLNRLEQVLARRQCADRGWTEALMLTEDNRVIGATMSNLFAVVDSRIVTPAITDAGVIGATRQRLLAGFAADGDEVTETHLSLADIQAADEVFVCNSAMPIWPVASVAGRSLAPGPVAGRAKTLLAASACAQ